MFSEGYCIATTVTSCGVILGLNNVQRERQVIWKKDNLNSCFFTEIQYFSKIIVMFILVLYLLITLIN